MARNDRMQKPSGSSPGGRPSLEPTDPLPLGTAVVQVVLLLGIPIGLLLFAKIVLRSFFPELGY